MYILRAIALFENEPALSKKRENFRQHKTAPAIVQEWKHPAFPSRSPAW
jgi:hypothetical protein